MADGKWDISSLITTSARTLYLRNGATATTPITAYTTFAVPRRPVAPSTPIFVYNDANYPDRVVLNGLTTDMEYKKSTDTTWSDVTESSVLFDPQMASSVYYVRTKATSQSFASANKSLTLAAIPAAPAVTYNKTTETLTKVSTAMEISFAGGPYTAITATTYNLSEMIDGIPANGTLEVKVRKKATTTAPASLDAVFIIEARIAAMVELLVEPEVIPGPETSVEPAGPETLEEPTGPETLQEPTGPETLETLPEAEI